MYLYLLLALYSWQNMILHPRMNSAACRWIPAEASKTNLWQSTLWTLLAELPEGAVQANCVGTKPTWTCFLSPFCIHTFSDKNGSNFLNQLEQNQFWSSFATGCRQIWTTRLNVRWNNFPKNPHLFWVLSPVQILRSYPHAMHSIQFACLFEPPRISSKKACPNLCVFNFINMFSWYKCSSTCSTTKTYLCNCSLFRLACDFGVLDFIADLIGCFNVFLRRIWFGSSQMDMLYVWGRCGLCQRHFAGHRLAFKFASVAVAAPKLLEARFAAPRTNCVWCVFAKGCFPLGCAPKSAIFCGTWEIWR